MKTLLTFTFLMAIAVLISSQANAQNASQANSNTQVNTGKVFVPGTFVDKDNNGICDNYESRGTAGRGRYFTDKNQDGICDNKGNKAGRGRGQGYNCRKANGKGHQGNRGNGCCRRSTSN